MSLPQDVSAYVNEASASPVPEWLFSASLLYKGLSTPRPVDPKLGSGGSVDFSRSIAQAAPKRASCFLFGSAAALGGYIIYDGDVSNGAGFSFAWSTLYLLVNGKPAVKSLLRGHVVPMSIASLALGTAGLYGKQFFWPSKRLA